MPSLSNIPLTPHPVVAGKTKSYSVGSTRCRSQQNSTRLSSDPVAIIAHNISWESINREHQEGHREDMRDIVNSVFEVDQVSHLHVPGEIVKGEVVKGVINQANLQ